MGTYGRTSSHEIWAPGYKSQFRYPSNKLIYEYIQTNGFITTAQILSITSITTKGGVSVALSRLRAMGWLEKCTKDGK